MAGVRAPGRQAGDLKFSGGDGSGQFDRGHDRAVSVALEFYRIMGAGVNPPPDGSLPVPVLTWQLEAMHVVRKEFKIRGSI